MDNPSSSQPAQPTGNTISEGVPSFQQGTAKPAPSSSISAKMIGLVVGGLALVLIAFLGIRALMSNQAAPSTSTTKQVSLTWWGLWEPNEVLNGLIQDFQTQNPGVTVTYSQQSVKDYRERLQSAFDRSQGPDIFRFHNTWVPMLSQQNIFSTVPTTAMTSADYQATFYPSAVKDLRTQNGFVGIPLMTDGLAMFVNKKALAATGKQAPTTWQDFSILAKDLTIRDADGKIQRAGAAMGSANNVDHFSDVLGLLILQNGGNPGIPDDANHLVSDALTFYTQFLRTDRVWDETLPNSTYAFAIEKAAIMFAPSWRAFEIKQINPNIDFAVFPVPQLSDTKVNWSSYWVEGVSRTSQNQDVAWKLLKFISTKQNLQKMYTQASSQRLFGEPYPRVDMAVDLSEDPYVGAFIKQAPVAQSWYLSSRTFDNGINDQIIKYYQDAINKINQGSGVPETLPTLSSGVTGVLSKYGVRPQ
jgi:multiple sugar transport system substrate-binding protein